MKRKRFLIALLLLSFPFFSYSQSVPSAKTFSVKELLMMLDTLPPNKITDHMLQHGYKFESKGNVYAPDYKGPVKNAYTLRYLKSKQHFIIYFYADKKYLIHYSLESEQDFDNLVKELEPAGFKLVWQKEFMNYYDFDKFRVTTAQSAAFKVFSLADRLTVEKYNLMPF